MTQSSCCFLILNSIREPDSYRIFLKVLCNFLFMTLTFQAFLLILCLQEYQRFNDAELATVGGQFNMFNPRAARR
jgi:hypothetical protein